MRILSALRNIIILYCGSGRQGPFNESPDHFKQDMCVSLRITLFVSGDDYGH